MTNRRATNRRATNRVETEQERLTRNLRELLQELRVAQAGVQILFGFLLAVAFTEPFRRGTGFQHGIYLVTALFSVASIALLIAPAAWHRMLFRRGQRERLVGATNKFAVAGLVCLAGAMTGTVLLIADVVFGGWVAIAIATVTGIAFSLLWFAVPRSRRRSRGFRKRRVMR